MKQKMESLLRDGFILVFNVDELDVVKTAQAVQRAGMNNMEITCRISDPLTKISRVKQELPDFVAGAASLIDFEPVRQNYNQANPERPIPSVKEVVDAGADYLVSAINFQAKTYETFGHLPICPGCGTASEIVEQSSFGANFCKLFPASVIGGVKYIKSIDPAIHKFISIMPTGGTNFANMPDYIDAGVLILGGSFSMFGETFKTIVAEQNYDLLTEELIKVKTLIDREREKKYPTLDFKTATLAEIESVTGRNFNTKENDGE